MSIGAADSNRYVVASFHARKGGASTSVTSVTIGGVSATEIITQANHTTNTNIVSFWYAAVPTGTTATCVVTFADTMVRAACNVWRVIGFDFTSTHDEGSSTASSPTYDLDIPAGGIALAAVSFASNGDGSTSWSNLTEQTDTLTEGFLNSSAADDEFASSQTNLTITATPSGTDLAEPCGVFFSLNTL